MGSGDGEDCERVVTSGLQAIAVAEPDVCGSDLVAVGALSDISIVQRDALSKFSAIERNSMFLLLSWLS